MAPARFNPRPQTPNNDPREHPNQQPGRSLTEELGATVDDLRQLYTDFGQRPYRVFSVIVSWSGGSSGRGDAVVQQETELLPTPLVVDMKSVRGRATPGGFDEAGGITIKQISPRYTEDDIRALFFVQPLPVSKDGFLEVRVDSRDGETRRRRFVVKGAPYRDAGKFDWSARMVLQSHDRDRDGTIRDDVTTPAEVQLARFDEGQ